MEKFQHEDDGLCCCEYINENGEMSHILTTFCNCEAIDETFERLISRQGFRAGLSIEVTKAIEDRFRIPWRGGAKKVHFSLILPLILNPVIIVVGSLSRGVTMFTYSTLLPSIVYCCHRWLKPSKTKPLTVTEGWTEFYPSWLVSAAGYLMFIYYTCVIAELKISAFENLAFVTLFVSSCFCFYVVYQKGQGRTKNTRNQNQITRPDLLPRSTSLNVCCDRASEERDEMRHCRICGVCVLRKDHHCLWLKTCIGHVNARWFLCGLFLAWSCLAYGVYLTFTTVCYPLPLDMYFFEVLYPSVCPNAYVDVSSSLMVSGGSYAILVFLLVSLLLIQQSYSISRGLRRSSRKRNYAKLTCWVVVSNWYQFWTE